MIMAGVTVALNQDVLNGTDLLKMFKTRAVNYRGVSSVCMSLCPGGG